MIRCIRILLGRFGECAHCVGRELTGCGQCRVARIGLVDPGLRRGAIGGRKRFQLAPRLGDIVAHRRRGHPRDDGIALVARDGVGALDADQPRGTGLHRSTMPDPVVEFSCAGDSFGSSASSSRLSALLFGTPVAAKLSSGFNASALAANGLAAASAAA